MYIYSQATYAWNCAQSTHTIKLFTVFHYFEPVFPLLVSVSCFSSYAKNLTYVYLLYLNLLVTLVTFPVGSILFIFCGVSSGSIEICLIKTVHRNLRKTLNECVLQRPFLMENVLLWQLLSVAYLIIFMI